MGKKLPKSITIKGRKWRVVVSEEWAPLMGTCEEDPDLIWIRQSLSDEEKWITFKHEVMHAIEYAYGIELGHRMINLLED